MPPSGFSHQRSQSTSSLPPSSVGGSSFGVHARHSSTSLARGPGAHVTRPTGIPSFRGYYYYYSLSLRTGSNQDVGGLIGGPLLGGGRQQQDKDAKEKEKKKKARGGGNQGGGGKGGGGAKHTRILSHRAWLLGFVMTRETNITMDEKNVADEKRSVVRVERTKVKKRRSTLETLIKFGTDASGLERTFRLFQAIAQCIQSFSSVRSILIYLFITVPQVVYTFLFFHNNNKYSTSPSNLITQSWLERTDAQWMTNAMEARSRLAKGRRFFRVFRFVESFHSAFTLTNAHEEKDLATWLDISAKSFNGMYLLFETLVFFSAVDLNKLSPFSRETEEFLNVEGQRFWFFALVCGVLAGVVRLWEDYRRQEQEQVRDGRDNSAEKEKGSVEEEDEAEDEHVKQLKEEERQRAAVEQKKERDAARKGRRTRILRRIVADLLDIPQPGAVVGWTPFLPGTVGVMMIGSTLLTGMEVWDKCSRL
ncbi:peroxisomal biogenesis factor 11-domain-containing protein [Sordaria brevicollis]|uniref:Peroxisomal biogenesis factor 11-domain-containing protein n=1 Tax=Sordaria brevicollis TaxID=83679 RepID=A0AAE0PL03_SORBR|nr:peroxisomal biogenesis factor 11-domain-containing protein [Sordaria brevicollis]